MDMVVQVVEEVEMGILISYFLNHTQYPACI